MLPQDMSWQVEHGNMGTWVFGKWPRERISNRWKNMWRNTAVGTHPYVASSSTVLALDTIDFTTAVLDAFYVLRPLPDVKGCTQLMKLKYIIWITCTWFKRPVQDKRNNLSSDCISRFDACVLVSPGDRPDFCDVSWCCLFILHLSYHIISYHIYQCTWRFAFAGYVVHAVTVGGLESDFGQDDLCDTTASALRKGLGKKSALNLSTRFS